MKLFYRPILPDIRKNTVLFENSQALPACLTDKNRMDTKGMGVMEQ
jgi:hypothetical protein